MKIYQLIKRLEKAEENIKKAGGDPEASEVMIEAIDDNGHIYYENSFQIFIDDRNDVGISPVNK